MSKQERKANWFINLAVYSGQHKQRARDVQTRDYWTAQEQYWQRRALAILS